MVLTTIRHFRDTWLSNQPNGANIIENYYFIAPKIVDKINQKENSIEIYNNIWIEHLNPFFNTILQNKNELAFKIYHNMVKDLEITYLK